MFKRFWPHHFSKQILLLTTITIVISTTTLTTYQISEVKKLSYENAQDMLGSIAENIALGVTHSLIIKDYAEVESLLRRAAIFPDIRLITLTNTNGKVISRVMHEPNKPVDVTYSTPQLSTPTLKEISFQWLYGNNSYALALGLDATSLSIWYPIEKGGLGWLKINYSVEYVRDSALLLIRNSILLALCTLLVLTLLLSRLLKPNLLALRSATNFARGLNEVRGQQIDVGINSTEIDLLNNALNEASNRLYIQDQQVKASHKFLNNVLDASSVVSIIATDMNGLITVFNKGAERLLGYDAIDLVNKETPAKFHLMEEVQKRAQELSIELGYPIAGVQTFHEIADLKGSETREWTYIRKNGEHVPVSLVITTMRSDSGEIIGHLGIAQDISERQRNDKIKTEFVSTVSHELRTPLTAIAGALGLITGGALGEIPANAKQMIGIAHKNSLRLSFLINDLLDMEKLVAGKMSFDMKQQALMPLIEQALEGTHTYGADRHVKLQLTQTEPAAQILIDGQRLMQVLSNLLSNAIKYSPEEGTVEISVQSRGKSVRVSVIDRGPGIPEEFRNRIFGKFTQADSSDTRQKGGTGLGLAITREFVQRMGGSIGFDSMEGQGSTFYFEFPLSN